MAFIKLKPTKTNAKGKKTHKHKNRFERIIQAFLNILIPALVVINNNIGFFILISLLLLWKFVNFFNNLKAYNIL